MTKSRKNWTPAQWAVARKIAYQRRWIGRQDRPDASVTHSAETIECQRASERRYLIENAQILVDRLGISLEAAVARLYPEGLDAKIESRMRQGGWIK